LGFLNADDEYLAVKSGDDEYIFSKAEAAYANDG